MKAIEQGTVVWAWLDPSIGREQSGRRPVLVVSSRAYNDTVDTLLITVPISSVDRGWPNHIRITGIPGLRASYAMTEQPRAISRERVGDSLGIADLDCLDEVKRWLGDFVAL